MTNLDELLNPIEDRLKAATPGPWYHDMGNWDVEQPATRLTVACLIPDHLTDVDGNTTGMSYFSGNGDLIAHAPTDLATLIALAKRQDAALLVMEDAITEYHSIGCNYYMRLGPCDCKFGAALARANEILGNK